MREQLEQRLTALRAERERGAVMLAELDQQRTNLHQTVLRIEGAIQLCQELLNTASDAGEVETNGDNR